MKKRAFLRHLLWSCAVLCPSAYADQSLDLREQAAMKSVKSVHVLAEKRRAIGSATQTLLQMQREGAVLRARPIDGHQAERSYARYLKSFERDIPGHYDSGVSTK